MSLYKRKGIYSIINTINNKIYIGCTDMNFGDRRDCHFAMLRNNYHYNNKLQDDFNFYGEDIFIFNVLEDIDSSDPEIFYEKEKEYIKLTNSMKDGYNLTIGGLGTNGSKFSKERRQRTIENNRNCMLGRKLDDETKMKMSETRRKNQDRIHDGIGAILKPEEVLEIKRSLMNGERCKELANKYNVTVQCISRINMNKNWIKISPEGWEEYISNLI